MRSLDTCYCYFPAAAEVPVVVVVDTVADIVVAAAAAAAVDRWTRTASSPTSTEAPSTSSTSPPSAAPARRNLKRKTEEEERERERARSPSAAVAAVAALLPSSRQEAIKAEALTSSPEEEVPVDCTVVAAVVVDSLHPRREDWYYTRLVEIAAPSSEVGERLCLFIHQRKGDQNGGTKEEMLCQQAVRARIFSFAKKIERSNPIEKEKREERREMPLQKSRFSFPGLTHRKSFAAAAAAAAAEAEAARHRTKKGEVGTRSFEKRASSYCFFCTQVAFFFRRRERKRKREKARALIIERIGL